MTKQQLQKLQAKNIAPLLKRISSLPKIDAKIFFEDSIKILYSHPTSQIEDEIYTLAKDLKPWRKGPFHIGNLHIDSEWQSFKKFDLIAPHLNIQDKDVADIGCNNGYYMFKMLPLSPKSITGFDPSALFKCQFDFINHFIQSKIRYELLGVEDLANYGATFDVILCMGVLYHRTDPITTLKHLSKSLNKEGEVILDTLILDSQEEIVLCPPKSYAKMSNAYFIPSIHALRGWCERAGFDSFECLATIPTDTQEQRKTDWIDSLSLEDFLDPLDSCKTIEGYPAPIRGYFKLKRR
ncbi:tRNA 5-methoxyuridine(34)/uridine 5-oxyacetic acid(34) synthase CmoB [Helicobacter pametensis]|uniref:tRNA 5-methoxyuridine(34)/uridine 5-oxyacetic acid(34) synthase CmoB n=1 Tax=Helicobacter pametensis TaxID=95149 RepID=UPI0004883FB1|nr:tRNA 5-methoxyuridine(34)/uridine 5-oxyacetic acid(34) synthase CmoB [Helicobacter pametensis]